MAKAGRWIRSFWTGKKDKDKHATATAGDHTPPQGAADHPTPTRSTTAALTTPAPPREKKRWSFRRSVGNSKELGPPVHADVTTTAHPNKQAGADAGRDTDQKRHAAAVAAATAAATDAAIAAAQAAAVVIHLTSAAPAQGRPPATAREEAAAVKIQAAFRSYLAQKALRALKGLVKLQALIRGHLVRKQATATLRCMETLVSVQARARAHRIRMAEEAQLTSHRTSYHRGSPSPLDPRVRRAYEMDRNAEEDIKIVEMDVGDRRGGISRSRNSYSASASQGNERADPRLSSYIPRASTPRVDHHHHHHHHQRYSPAPSTLMDNMSSPRGCSGHFDEFSFRTAQTSPHYYYSAISKLDYGRDHYATSSQQDDTYSISSYYNPFCPSYMANTESSRAKVRSQSAPRQRPDTCERTPSRRKQSLEGRNIPRAVKMQRSSSQAGSPSINGRQIPWALKQLDRSCISVKDSECGSTSSMMTNPNYCRSLVPYDGTRS